MNFLPLGPKLGKSTWIYLHEVMQSLNLFYFHNFIYAHMCTKYVLKVNTVLLTTHTKCMLQNTKEMLQEM